MEHKLEKITRGDVHIQSEDRVAQIYLERFHLAYDFGCAINHCSFRLLEPLLHNESELRFMGEDPIGKTISFINYFNGKKDVLEHFEKLFTWFRQRTVVCYMAIAWRKPVLIILQESYLENLYLQNTGKSAPSSSDGMDISILRLPYESSDHKD